MFTVEYSSWSPQFLWLVWPSSFPHCSIWESSTWTKRSEFIWKLLYALLFALIYLFNYYCQLLFQENIHLDKDFMHSSNRGWYLRGSFKLHQFYQLHHWKRVCSLLYQGDASWVLNYLELYFIPFLKNKISCKIKDKKS